MNIFRTFTVLGLIWSISGCSSNPMTPLRDVSYPELNITAKAYLGERLLMQGKGYRTDILYVSYLNGRYVEVQDQMFCREPTGSQRYVSFNSRAVRFLNFVKGTRGYTGTVQVKKGKVCVSDIWSGCFGPNKASFSIEQNGLCASPNSMQRIIEYNGKTGEVLNFTYREVYRNRIAAPLTQNFKMDLREGRIINYKGARLRIDQATNQEIQYAVLKNFASQ